MGRQTRTFAWLVFIPAILLNSLGLVTLLSRDPVLFYQQAIFTAVGLGLFWLFYHIDFELYQYLYKFFYVGAILFLLMAFLGPNVRGATRWIDLGGFRIQPSEIIKPFFLITLASLLVRYPPTKIKFILYHLGLFGLPFLIIYKQPDLGNAIVYAGMWLFSVVLAGMPVWFLVLGGGVLGGLLPFGYRLLHEYQRQRILTFLNPLSDPRGTGYNAIQAMIAVGSGQWFGRGFGKGTQSLLNFLPEQHTDFIFAAFSEEFGFIGALVLLAIFFIFLWKVLRLTNLRQDRQLAFLYSAGFFTQLFIHVIINVGMNLGLVPITGITLPFISYGGSSLISLWIGLGILFSADFEPHQAASRG
ncbi:MAG: rod shape-determining protein RodA [Candidatus Gottesmanbacteria bacterium GW2011_GWB1_43_11]|uniref:Rod shape-determining protein RodA n=1 Tax=Candidatus Gottesmanbacteria bacterium GW2011_GWB1_43_11 TaxID=1618446 RepID=A0A0G1CPY2_9BACT|nr:MAG: rod shape-determining protein RodA [Candidatus Gottesmanbacteria bacterium GW2011_GWA2_42_16]KKS55980.1 MAG: rod shape-determining protein RodA [Candidatus Gottesmanbacteria bacterium GW2011_GWA1_42_26]KKS82348.1 MAG: rod shape-determining protein RodA [Candidatus Gottesmanbacteria bacterium GW2011_GWC1_43_10]KKS87542.1 MAG: rod shape-determining protein RodA [Candidatus Gottesmanbacteria bacterium GW2011_GWB1_43_11]OGG10355.1 MAG: hypothetical protein A2699_00930 [Candidatus Gottesmanb